MNLIPSVIRKEPGKRPTAVRIARTLGLLPGLLLTLPAAVHAQFTYRTNHGTITITGYTGSGGAVVIPSSTNGYPVASIGDSAFGANAGLTSITIPDSVTSLEYAAFWYCTSLASVTISTNVTWIGMSAFYGCASLTNITIPDSVTCIGYSTFEDCASLTTVTIGTSVTDIRDDAFSSCCSLTGVYFRGNAPGLGHGTFEDDDNATVYYLAGTTGWGRSFGGRPAVLWDSPVKATAASFGVRTNRFGFNIIGATNIPVVVEACTNLALPGSPRRTQTRPVRRDARARRRLRRPRRPHWHQGGLRRRKCSTSLWPRC